MLSAGWTPSPPARPRRLGGVPEPSNRYVHDLTRAELLEELRTYRDDDGLDHVAGRDGQDVGDPEHLSDDDLRELLKLARWRRLLWAQQGE